MPGHQASRTLRRAATVLPLAASLVVGLFGCAEANRILVSGNVDDDLVVVQAPQIEVPEPDPNAGFADAETGTPGLPCHSWPDGRGGLTAERCYARGSWSRVATVEVREGDQVQTGQVLVRFDSKPYAPTSVLPGRTRRSRLARSRSLTARSTRPMTRNTLSKSALKKINNAIRQLKSTRAKLSGQLLSGPA